MRFSFTELTADIDNLQPLHEGGIERFIREDANPKRKISSNFESVGGKS